VLRACLIDGFGWFPETVYRRNWLLFDDVEYAFPQFVKSISIPSKLYEHREFALVQPDLDEQLIDSLAETALLDARDSEFRAYVESSVPKRDAQYAGGVVYADNQVRARHPREQLRDPAFALSYLARKLVAYTNSTGAVPIVGQDYALNILSRVVSRDSSKSAPIAADSLVFGRQALVVHAIAAGLSLRFIPDDLMEKADFDSLSKFKDKSSGLREAHHAHLLKVANDYDGLPTDAQFPERLARLRADAESVRIQLDEEARDLWLSSGLDLAGKALIGAAGAAVAAVALIRADLLGALTAAIPGAVTGISIAIAKAVETLHKATVRRRSYVSYLTDARNYLSAL
jgi:hypothetical protein